MADENIKDFTVNWFLLGFLFVCLTTTSITFMYHNNPDGLADTEGVLQNTLDSVQSSLIDLPEGSDVYLNITSKTNPELGFLGSRDSVATSYGTVGMAKGFFTESKVLIAYVFTGTTGQILLGLFGGLFGIVSLYYIIKFFRNAI